MKIPLPLSNELSVLIFLFNKSIFNFLHLGLVGLEREF
jgi:hypothetical protein